MVLVSALLFLEVVVLVGVGFGGGGYLRVL